VLKRTLLYLRRKKDKTVTLFVLVFLISTFVVSSFALLHTTDEVSTAMRTAVGAQIHVRQQFRMEDGNSVVENSFISEQAISEIMMEDQVRQYNGRNSGYVDGLSFISGANATEYDNIGRIRGSHYSQLIQDFDEQVLELTEGRHLTPDDENVVIISQLLALENELSVGDTIELIPAKLGLDENEAYINTMPDTNISVEVEIIGIFIENEPQPTAEIQPTAGLNVNQIFSDHKLLMDLSLANSGEYEMVSFYIEDPQYLQEIMDEIQRIETVDWDDFFIQYNDSSYTKISEELQTIQSLILTLLVAVGIVSSVILSLILVMRMRGRIHEVGILMSVGISKKEILGQLLLEVITVSALAFVLSYISAGWFARYVEREVLANLQVMQDIENVVLNAKSSVFLTMPFNELTIIYLLILLIIVATAFFSTMMTVRLKPKEILSKMS